MSVLYMVALLHSLSFKCWYFMWFVFYIVDLLNFGHNMVITWWLFLFQLLSVFVFLFCQCNFSPFFLSFLFLSVYHYVCPSPSLLTPASLHQATGYILYLTLKVERLPFEKFRSYLFLTINSRKFSLYTSNQ